MAHRGKRHEAIIPRESLRAREAADLVEAELVVCVTVRSETRGGQSDAVLGNARPKDRELCVDMCG